MLCFVKKFSMAKIAPEKTVREILSDVLIFFMHYI